MSKMDSVPNSLESPPLDDQVSDAVSPQARPSERPPSGVSTFILIFLAFHIPLFIYPVLRLASWLELGWLLTLSVLLPVAASQVMSRWLLRNARSPLSRGLRHVTDFLLGLSPILLITLLIFELLVALAIVAPYQAAILVLGLSVTIAFFGVVVALLPFVRTISFSTSQLQSPLRFVQITDVHVGSRSGAFLSRVVDKIQALEPEFLCITGDFIDATGVPVSEYQSLARLSCPIYFCTGNHERYEDLAEILERLDSLGVQVLRTQSLHHRSDVQVLGIDDRDDALQVQRELAKLTVDPEAFTLLMYHRPKGLVAAQQAGIDLMISGHTHNGQIMPFNLIVRRVFDEVVGLYQRGKTRLYVSQGTGTWGPVMRIGTRGEITLFELTNKPE